MKKNKANKFLSDEMKKLKNLPFGQRKTKQSEIFKNYWKIKRGEKIYK